jgi:3-carboxy-cis,cis-muconate cycloisomerase
VLPQMVVSSAAALSRAQGLIASMSFVPSKAAEK